MNPAAIFRFLMGHGPSIDAIARSRRAIWTVLILVRLTAIARHYDQTLITQAPIRWLFGSLAFSLVSGTWVYI